jgi:uncharacterized protein (DUF433 family)
MPDRRRTALSFTNLVEAHVIRALRTEHGVSIKAVRAALEYAERTLGMRRLLLRPELRTEGGDLLLEKYGQLINLSRSGQLALKKLLEAYLKRIERATDELPVRLFPLIRGDVPDGPRIIAIDPAIAFGRPVLYSRGVTTAAIAGRIDAGETLESVAADYDVGSDQIEEAVIFERTA